MDRADVVEGLRAIIAGDFEFEETQCQRGAIEAAIAALTPEPVTEAGLRAMGFEEANEISGTKTLRLRTTPITHSAKYIQCDVVGSQMQWGVRTFDQYISFPGIESMQTLRHVVAALRGEGT